MDLSYANLFVTGGAGTLGRAIARRRKQDGWTGKLTVYSTDNHKHERMRMEYPDVNFVQGDIRNYTTLYNSMVGHDVVIHAGAVKVIPDSELWSMDTFDVNVVGSMNVCAAAVQAHVAHVAGISTDKACHAANAYGATKYLMEKTFQEYARLGLGTQFHLVRYGNVLESNGSVIEAWRKAAERHEKIKITDPEMTRFWLSPSQAVSHVMDSLLHDSGLILIPKMPSLSIGKLAEYTVGLQDAVIIPIRPGEKQHETLLTYEEGFYADDFGGGFVLRPTIMQMSKNPIPPYTSFVANRLTQFELQDLLNDSIT